MLPSESGRLFVYPRVTVESIDKTIVLGGTDRDLARSIRPSLPAIPPFRDLAGYAPEVGRDACRSCRS